MSYDAEAENPYERGSRDYFRELDARIFHPRVFRLATDRKGRPFGHYIDLDALAGKRLLDVGCGSGLATQVLARAGADVTAVDLTNWAVETTKLRLAAFGLEGEVLQADAEELPFEDESFDVVFSWGVIMMSTDMARALRELIRVLRPGGQLILMLYNRHSLFYPIYKLMARFLPLFRRFGFQFEGARAGETKGLIVRHLTREEARRLVEREGIRNVRTGLYGQDSELLPLPRRVRVPITDRIPQEFRDRALRRLGHELVVVGTKQPR
jgi:ubiquinone/menaquinone biosynthesis C-methylase UbiE